VKGFKTQWDFQRFQASVLERFRYIHEPVVNDFFDAVLHTASTRVTTVAARRALWRAQIGCNYIPVADDKGGAIPEREEPYGKDRMKPMPFEQYPGRLNAVGTNCLYLAFADDQEDAKATAIAEVRPWIHAMLSVALFTNPKNLRIVDCASDPSHWVWLGQGKPSEETKEKIIWSQINYAFAEPVALGDEPRSYVPTQILAELFRSQGYDGVAYGSSLGPGHNLALFDLEAAEFKWAELHRLEKVIFETSHLV